MGLIVVGIDGSDESKRALHWAVEEARLRGAKLLAVHAWSYQFTAGPDYAPAADPDFLESLRQQADQVLDEALAEAGTAGVEIERTAVEGPPAATLVDAAEGADLLVVGSRGRGGFSGLLLGSVSQQAAHHAPCPVVIVPPARS
jgi:nucleotide-binding universal stress UspA family protein